MKIGDGWNMGSGSGETISTDERAELALQLAGEWWMTAMSGLFKTVDHDLAIESMRPHLRQSGMEAGYHVKHVLRPGEASLQMLAYNVVTGLAHVQVPGRIEITEGGVVANMGGCWATSTNIQECYCRLHEINLNGNCEAIDPEYMARLTEMPTPQSQTCKAVIRKKTVPLKDWEDFGQVIAVAPKTDIPEDILARNRLLILYDYWAMTVDGFSDAVGGEEAIRTLRPCMVKSGTAWGLKLGRRFGIGPGQVGVTKLVDLFSQIMGLEGDIVVSKDRVDKAIGTCPFIRSSKEVCALFDSFVEGLCSSIDQEFRFTHHQIACPSLPACYWMFKG
jgi:hypothetical protein